MTTVRLGAVGYRVFSRATTALVGAALTLSISGCWAMALQFAPTALMSGVQLASAAVGAAQSPGDSNAPGVIELRKDAAGTPEYRELKIEFTPNEARWTPVVASDTAADGWRPAEHFMEMNFSPPLPSVIADSQTTFLAYAPATPKSADDEERLKQFDRSFGDPVGTFKWNGRLYQYSLPPALPPLQLD